MPYDLPTDRPAVLAGSYPLFQGIIDKALRKGDPRVSIPWSDQPGWAYDFRPRRVVDVGCAKGEFTTAVLERLGEWGCLSQLSEVVLIDNDAAFAQADLALQAVARCREVVERYAARPVTVRFLNSTVKAKPFGADEYRLEVGDEWLEAADLIIASHVTYYFEAGGASLLKGVLASLSASQGLAWVVARRQSSPIYRARTAFLESKSQSDPSARDFAEFVEQALGESRQAHVIDAKDLEYLSADCRGEDCLAALHLLTWRALPDEATPEEAQLVQSLCAEPHALFSERHLILGTR